LRTSPLGVAIKGATSFSSQEKTNDPFKNETQEDLKRFKKYFGTNHSMRHKKGKKKGGNRFLAI
jgi:hypothetical protein